MAARTLISKLPSSLLRRPASLHRIHPIAAVAAATWRRPAVSGVGEVRCFSTRQTQSSLNDSSPNWSNRPPKETIMLDGCDFEHWLVVVDPPEPNMTRDEIIESYIKKLAEVVGSEEQARQKIYSVSTRHYFAFGALVSEEESYKIKTLEKVRWVLPDSYLDVRNKDYGGEPFIDGVAVPYDPKYHEEWVRNNARANERNRRNDRPRNNDRSRNFEVRKENMQNFQRGPPPNQNFQGGPPPNQNFQGGPPPNQNFQGGPPPNQNFQGGPPPNQNFQNGPPRDGPPMPNSPPNAMPPRNAPPMHSGPPQNGPPMPNRDFNANNGGPPRAYPNQMPTPQAGYAPDGGRAMPNGPAFQGNNQGYRGGNPAAPGNQGYGQGYQSPPPNYQQGGTPNYQQGGYQQQGANQGYGPPSQGYPSGGQGGAGGYQSGGSDYQQGGHGGGYQNVPGRD